jgi:hypothetical protein
MYKYRLKENKSISNIQKPRFIHSEREYEAYNKIIRAFHKGDDKKAIDSWKHISYSPLPIDGSDSFYVLALKLKDVQLLDYENAENVNLGKDKQIAEENHKLRSEIDNLAKAIDSIMRDKEQNRRCQTVVTTSPDSSSMADIRKQNQR